MWEPADPEAWKSEPEYIARIDANAPPIQGMPLGACEDRCAVCGILLGYGIPELHLKLCGRHAVDPNDHWLPIPRALIIGIVLGLVVAALRAIW